MAIYFSNKNKTFYLQTKDTSYVFRVNEQGFLQHLYFGPKIYTDDLGHTEYLTERQGVFLHNADNRTKQINQYHLECASFAGRGDYKENMLTINNDGSRLSDFKYCGFKIIEDLKLNGLPSLRDGQTLCINLKDKSNKVDLELYYTVFEDESAICRSCKITNKSDHDIKLDRAYSFGFDLSGSDWQTITMPGGWLKERYALERQSIAHGVFSIDSKRCASSSQLNPFLALVKQHTTEDVGPALGINLVYSGDFVLKVQKEETDDIRIVGGINDFDFEWTLQPKKSFYTPQAVIVYSSQGLGKMSRDFHDLYRKHLINPNWVQKPRPIVINNWEATYFDFDENKLFKLIDSVKGTGIDTFVLDDGWFGARNDDSSSLGDWFVNRQKLPNGLKPVIDYAHKNNLKFGLWLEPEMISENSRLFKIHPDWAIHAPNIAPSYGRNQYILDLTREDVRKYVVNTICSILDENDIDYVKWDMNRTMTENYSKHLGERSKEMHHRYILGLYEILDSVMSKHPNVFFEGCASGGARFDPGMLYYFPQIWTSDNSDAFSRSIIQYNTSLCYPLSSMDCHVSVSPNHQTGRKTSMKARDDISNLGAKGYELDTTKLSNEEFLEIKKNITYYHDKMEKLVLNGDHYRLSSMTESNVSAQQIVDKMKKRSVVVAMRGLNTTINGPAEIIYPKGLDENKIYNVIENTVPPKFFEAHGSTIMNAGLVCHFNEVDYSDFTTDTFEIEEKQNILTKVYTLKPPKHTVTNEETKTLQRSR